MASDVFSFVDNGVQDLEATGFFIGTWMDFFIGWFGIKGYGMLDI